MSAQICLVPLLAVAPRYPENRRHLALVGHDHGGMTVEDVLSRWLSRCDSLVLDTEGSPLARSTRDGQRIHVDNLLRALGDSACSPAERLRPDDVQTAVSAIARKDGGRGGPYAARSARDTLRAAYKHARVDGLAVLPTEGVRVARKIQRRDTHIPQSTMRAIDTAAEMLADEGSISAVAADAIRFGVRQGMRRTDILAMKVENLHADELWILAWIHKAKQWVRIPLSPESLAILETRAREAAGGWLFPGRRRHGRLHHLSNVTRSWSLVLDRVGEMPVEPRDPNGPRNIIIDHRCRRLVFHHLRHAFVSHALAAGVSAVDIARAIGQTNWQSVGAYASAGIEGARRAVDAVAQLVSTTMAEKPKGTVGSRLAEAMAAKGMIAEDLAAAMTKADKGNPVGWRSIYGYTADERLIPADRIPVICKLLDISADWLLGVSRG